MARGNKHTVRIGRPTTSNMYLFISMNLLAVASLIPLIAGVAPHCTGSNMQTGNTRFTRSQCNLTEVPPDISPDVSKIVLDNNLIPYLKRGTFTGMMRVNYLNLEGNLITFIDYFTFEGLSNINHINIANNQIFGIHENAFKWTPHLIRLDLQDNEIKYLAPGTFERLTMLTHLDLRNNKLQTLEMRDDWRPKANLTLGIDGNPLVCDFRLVWMQRGEAERWLTYKGAPPTCVNYPGIPFKDVNLTHNAAKDASTFSPEFKNASNQVLNETNFDTRNSTAGVGCNCTKKETSDPQDCDNTTCYVLSAIGIIAFIMIPLYIVWVNRSVVYEFLSNLSRHPIYLALRCKSDSQTENEREEEEEESKLRQTIQGNDWNMSKTARSS